ncbi:hypothetical protein PI125_g17405 [Phytophthora idaei]|nr:hypothetical protein PI125_g17405 [Phytophthora idaei]
MTKPPRRASPPTSGCHLPDGKPCHPADPEDKRARREAVPIVRE